jgi:short-subunit dehydrogenase
MGVPIAGARVLLTGASGGIGAAIARGLASNGAQLVLSGRRADVLDALASELGARSVAADLAERAEVAALLAVAGELDVLVACAALPASGRLGTRPQESIDRAIEVNLRAPIALARALAPGMTARGRGALVFIGSLQSRAATAGASIYCATKFGLRGFALALRAELAPNGVGVSIVEPGFVREDGMYADTGIPLPRGVGTRRPADVADAVVRAIEHNRGELTVAPVTLSLGAQFAGVAPELAARLSRLAGGDRLARQFEEQQRDKS